MSPVYTIDIAHPPLHSEDAESVLYEALKKIQSSSHLRILKIIHGYGSGGKGGTLKTVVQNWAHVNRRKIKLVIDGADLTPFNNHVQMICAECHIVASQNLGESNNGITIIWVR